ncbi:8862_t:CDS:2, partial [Entrophospora sp. SA101]
WSLQHFSAMIAEYYESTNKRTIHNVFYKTLKGIENDQNFTEEVHQIAKELIKKKKVYIFPGVYFTSSCTSRCVPSQRVATSV